MQNLQLFLNYQLADLGNDTITLTRQINNLAEVQNQQGDFSKQFKVPLTQHNRAILGFPDEVPLTEELPYRKCPAKLVQDGFELFPEGSFAVLDNVEGDSVNVTLYSGNVDIFEAIDYKIWDMGDKTAEATDKGKRMPWRPYNHTWNLQNVVNSQFKTEGWIYPVVDYGKVSSTLTDPIDVRFLRPGFFLKTAIELIIANAGYKINQVKGSLVSDPMYPKLIVMMANDTFEHGAEYVSDYVGNNLQGESTQMRRYVPGQNGADEPLQFPQINYGNTSFYNAAYSAYRVKSDAELDISVEFSILVETVKDNGGVTIGIKVKPAGTNDFIDNGYPSVFYEPDHQGLGAATRFDKQKITYTGTFSPGDDIAVWYHVEQDVKGGTYMYFPAGAKFTVTEKKQNVLYGQQVQCEKIFPDVSQKDLLKDNLQRFGIICQSDVMNKTITFATFGDIVRNIPNAKDWTGKCLNQGKRVEFRLGNYGQNNTLKYKEDEGLTTESSYNPAPMPKGKFDDTIVVDDNTLAKNVDLFQSIFAPSLNRPYYGGTIAQILKRDPESDSDDFTLSTQPRLLIDQKLSLLQIGKTVTFRDGIEQDVTVGTAISVPYFYKSDGPYSLSWCDMEGNKGLKSTYYKELEKVLWRCKKVTRYFMLTAQDIAELDLLIPVYLQQDGCYFYINRVDSWVVNQPCKVELVRLG